MGPVFTARLSPKPFRTLLLIYGILLAGMACSWLRDGAGIGRLFRESPMGLTVFGRFLVGALLLLVYALLDRRPRLRIDATGIWTHRRGLMEWSSIRKVHVLEVRGRLRTRALRVEGPGGRHALHLDLLDKKPDAILAAVRHFSKGHPVALAATEVRG